MKLSQNFTLEELCESTKADDLGINNNAPAEMIPYLSALVNKVLQPIRDKFGAVIISSGYRCPELNKAISKTAKSTSQHMQGKAADITVAGTNRYELACWIRDNLDFDQCILESNWVHVSYNPPYNRKQCLTSYNGNSAYKQGLIKP